MPLYPLAIVVPTRNSSALLPRLVLSLQGQTWSDWRAILVDASSLTGEQSFLEELVLSDPRFSWVPQGADGTGIFGAMNIGFCLLRPYEWALFWGSDDWAASPTVLAEAMAALEASNCFPADTSNVLPDLLVCSGRYANAAQNTLGRFAAFQPPGLLNRAAYRRALLLGSTPPHQATFFGPAARQFLAFYAPGFRLSADLDYFLQLSRNPGLRVQCLDLELVHMADGGVSGQQTQRRVQEVCCAYRRAFGWYWCFPFLMRYLRRVASLLAWSR
jgi:glycosyltransferase involved in cell wall biosynthesis